MFLKKMNKLISRIPVSIRVTAWFTTFILILFVIIMSSAILIEDKIVNNLSAKELVKAVERIYEDPDEFENFDDGIYYIKYDSNNDIIAGKIPKDFDMTLAFSIEDINTYQIENKKFLYYDTKLKNTRDWIRGIYPLSKFQNEISKIWDIGIYLSPWLFIFVVIFGYRIIKNAFKPVKKISETALLIKKSKNFSNIILQLLEDYKPLLENSNIELIINIEKDLRIYGNKLMVERLFINLFINAIKFTKTTINVSLNRINKEIILQIKDDGVGIAKGEQKYIWDRFFQINNSRNKDKNRGSGLGLSMVNKIAQLHSAIIEVESEIGNGACFIVRFPI